MNQATFHIFGSKLRINHFHIFRSKICPKSIIPLFGYETNDIAEHIETFTEVEFSIAHQKVKRKFK